MHTVDTLKIASQDNLHRLQQWREEHNISLQTVGLVALAGVTGMAVGVIAAKGILAAKGATAIGAALTQHSGTVQGAATILTGATTLPDKAIALFGLLTNNALPISAGAVGGGAAGVGVMQGQVRRVKERLNEQVAQTAAAQAEASQVQNALRSAETQIKAYQSQVAAAPVSVTTNPLEQIQGIGPIFAKRLYEAGIVSLADLAAQTPEQVRAIMATVRGGKMINAQAWIDQARQLLGKGDYAQPPTKMDDSPAAA